MTPERAEAIRAEIAEMKAVQTRIYHVGRTFEHGEWQAFSALVGVFVSLCEMSLEQGVDWAYQGEGARIPPFKGKYLGEKFARVFGPFMHGAFAGAFLKESQARGCQWWGEAVLAEALGVEVRTATLDEQREALTARPYCERCPHTEREHGLGKIVGCSLGMSDPHCACCLGVLDEGAGDGNE